MDIKENVREHLLAQALNDLQETGIYWNGSISRNQRGPLVELLKEHGYEVEMSEVPPLWEHVFYTSEYSYDEILKIAKQRSESNDGDP